MIRKVTIIVVLSIIFMAGLFVFRKQSVEKNKYIAQVNGVGITQIAYEKRFVESISFFKSQNQDVKKLASLKKDVTDKLIDESLIIQYAEKNKIYVFENEINAKYVQIIDGYNRRNGFNGTGDEKFLLKIKEMYGTSKSDYLQTLKLDVLKEKVQLSVKLPLSDWLKQQKESAVIQVL